MPTRAQKKTLSILSPHKHPHRTGVIILVMKICCNNLSFTGGARAVGRRYCRRARLRVPEQEHGGDDEHDIDKDDADTSMMKKRVSTGL